MRTRGWQQKCETLELPCQRYQEQSEGQMGAFTSLRCMFIQVYTQTFPQFLLHLQNCFYMLWMKFKQSGPTLSATVIALFKSWRLHQVIVIRKAGRRRSWSSKQRPHCSVSNHLSPHRNNVDQQFDDLTGRPKKFVKLTNNSAGLDRQLLPAL